MKFNCEHCGEIDRVIVDGYRYGERLLEGVAFEVRRDDDGKYHAQVEETARDYLAQFNQRMYLDQIETDMPTEEFAICPDCGDEVIINQGLPVKPSMAATLQTFADIIGAGSFAGGFSMGAATYEPEIGDHEAVNETEAEPEETSSTEGGDSGGGGASEDLGEPEPEESNDESEESTESDSSDSSDDSSSDDADSSDDSSSDSSDSSSSDES